MTQVMRIPDFITHYSRGKPFQSITSLSPIEREQILATLNETNAWGLNRFKDQEYLSKRLQTEKKIKALFETAGGQPELDHPIYFFLGTNSRFEEHPDNRAYKIFLKDLPENSVSFTYGDSLLAFDDTYRKLSGDLYQNPMCGKVFLKRDLESLFFSADYPGTGALHIEVQLWVPAKTNFA